jgi:[acyl-carrier-protein] S-malonyltransferase
MSLSVGGAFHSTLMESASQDLNSAIDGAPLTVGKAQAFNVDGKLRTEPDEVRDALKRQLSAPVRWVDCVRSLLAVGVSRFIEVGPGGTLSAMGRRISSEAQWVPVNDIAGASQLTFATV